MFKRDGSIAPYTGFERAVRPCILRFTTADLSRSI